MIDPLDLQITPDLAMDNQRWLTGGGALKIQDKLNEVIEFCNQIQPVVEWAKLQMDKEKADQILDSLKH